MASLILLALSLGFMLFRVFSPTGAKPEGRTICEVTLTYRERLWMQRLNLISLGAILLLGAIGHWIRLPFEIVAMVAAYGIVMIPVRYTLTSTGIGINRVVFRRWSEFEGAESSRQKLTLLGQPGNGNFPIWLRDTRQREVLAVVRRYVHGSIRPRQTSGTSKGGPPIAHRSIRGLITRRS